MTASQLELDDRWARRATRPRPCVTIFTDASFDPNTGAAGWGAYFLRSAARFEAGGPMREPCSSPTQAELRAAANALSFAKCQELLSGRMRPYVVLQMDSTDALACILSGVPSARFSPGTNQHDVVVAPKRSSAIPSEYWSAIERIAAIIELTQIDLILRHIKGHRRGMSGRHGLNHRADRRARRGMRQAREVVA